MNDARGTPAVLHPPGEWMFQTTLQGALSDERRDDYQISAEHFYHMLSTGRLFGAAFFMPYTTFPARYVRAHHHGNAQRSHELPL